MVIRSKCLLLIRRKGKTKFRKNNREKRENVQNPLFWSTKLPIWRTKPESITNYELRITGMIWPHCVIASRKAKQFKEQPQYISGLLRLTARNDGCGCIHCQLSMTLLQ
jgi:hypothetical protein